MAVCHVHDTRTSLGHERPALSGVARPTRPGKTFKPVRGELGQIALPPARGFNDPLGHKLPRRNVAGTKGESGLFVRQSHEPGGVRIE